MNLKTSVIALKYVLTPAGIPVFFSVVSRSAVARRYAVLGFADFVLGQIASRVVSYYASIDSNGRMTWSFIGSSWRWSRYRSGRQWLVNWRLLVRNHVPAFLIMQLTFEVTSTLILFNGNSKCLFRTLFLLLPVGWSLDLFESKTLHQID